MKENAQAARCFHFGKHPHGSGSRKSEAGTSVALEMIGSRVLQGLTRMRNQVRNLVKADRSGVPLRSPKMKPGRLRRRQIACGIAAALFGVAQTFPAGAVVGPSDDGSRLSAFVVMVLSRSGPKAGFCSGIVLSQQAILTAAHCVPSGADLRIHFRGADGTPVLLSVAATLSHPGYRPDAVRSRERSIDLALVRLASPLPDRFRPAQIASAPSDSGEGASFRIAGYGVTKEGDGASSGRLRVATLEARAPLSQLLLWARDPHHLGTGACTGDSGGPILEAGSDTVAALTLWSAGEGKARCGALTQALWLAPQRNWIDEVLSRWRGED